MYDSVIRDGVHAQLDRWPAVILVGLMLTACLSAKQTVPADQDVFARGNASLRSSSGRFIVVAGASADRLLMARWADDVYRRLLDIWSPEIEIPREMILGIVADSRPDGTFVPGGIERRRWVDGRDVTLVLRIDSAARLDSEAFVEGICALILDAMILAIQSPDERIVFDERVPDWIAAGVAQSLYPTLRIRNQALVVELWGTDYLPAAGEILSWIHLPPHRTFEKAVSGVWVQWVAGRWPQRSAVLQYWLQVLSEGWTIRPESLLPDNRGNGTIEGWEPYVVSLQKLFTAGNEVGAAERFERLRHAMLVVPGTAGIPSKLELDRRAGLDALIPLRREPWMALFVRARMGELSSLAMAGDPEFQALVARMIDFINRLKGRHPAFTLRREYRQLRSDAKELETLALARERYLDAFESRYHPYNLPVRLSEDGLDAPPRSRMRSYVDGFDNP